MAVVVPQVWHVHQGDGMLVLTHCTSSSSDALVGDAGACVSSRVRVGGGGMLVLSSMHLAHQGRLVDAGCPRACWGKPVDGSRVPHHTHLRCMQSLHLGSRFFFFWVRLK